MASSEAIIANAKPNLTDFVVPSILPSQQDAERLFRDFALKSLLVDILRLAEPTNYSQNRSPPNQIANKDTGVIHKKNKLSTAFDKRR